jgi:hypothetical protein
MNRKTQPLTREQRRVLLLLRADDRWPNALEVTLRALQKRGLITGPGEGLRLTDAGRARLEVKRGRKPGGPTLAAREFAARQLPLWMEAQA